MDGNKEKRVAVELTDRALSSMNECLGFMPSTTKQEGRKGEKEGRIPGSSSLASPRQSMLLDTCSSSFLPALLKG